MAKQAVVSGQADNGTAQSPKQSSPVSEVNLGSDVLTDRKLEEILKNSILNEGDEQGSNSPASAEDKPETVAAESDADAPGDEVQTAEADTTTDLSQSESEQSDDEEEHDDPSLSEGVKKRFAKLTAKRREAEERLEDTRSELQQLREELDKLKETQTPAVAPDRENPFSHLERQEDVDREIAQARAVRRWCEANPDGAVMEQNGKEVEYTAEQVRQIKLNAMDAIEQHLPQRHAYIREAAKFNSAAEQMFPWWKERSSPHRQLAEQILAQAPELKRFPNYKLFLGDYLLGVAYREAKAKKAPAQPKRAPTQPAKPAATPPPKDRKVVDAESAKDKFAKTRNDRDLTQVVLTNFL